MKKFIKIFVTFFYKTLLPIGVRNLNLVNYHAASCFQSAIYKSFKIFNTKMLFSFTLCDLNLEDHHLSLRVHKV